MLVINLIRARQHRAFINLDLTDKPDKLYRH
nr:MAG TPA: hypothetical protein [Bacteriophage sp.]